MLRMGKNKPEQQPSPDETADYSTPVVNQSAANAPSTSAYNTNPYGTNTGSTPATTGSSPASYQSGYQGGTMAQDSNISRPVTESESLAREIKEGNLSGFVGIGTSLTGEANFKAMLRVDGHLSGRVSSPDGTLIVSSGGQVDADVQVSIALINGTVNGDIIATKRIEMGRVAKINGNIQTPALVVEQGAIFEGSCRMTQAQSATDTKSSSSATTSSSGAYTDGSSGKSYGKTDSPSAASASSAANASSASASSDATKTDSATSGAS